MQTLINVYKPDHRVRIVTGKQRDKTRIVEKRSDREKVEAIADLKNNKKQENLSELDKLRKRNRKSRIGVFFAHKDENRLSPVEFESTYEPKGFDRNDENASLTNPRGVKSGEVYKRLKRPSDEYGRKEYRNDVFASLSAMSNKLRARQGVKSREVYKRGSKPGNEEANTDTRANENENENGKCLARSFSEVSKSLVKIKELVHRRKTEELILRSKTARLAANESHYKESSPGKNSQSFDEMCRIEMELRETISREQKKLLQLQERKRRRSGKERERESRNNDGEKQHRSTETGQGEENMAKKSTKDSRDGNFRREKRLNPNRNAEYKETKEGNAGEKSVSYEKKVNELTRKTQTNRDSATKSSNHKEGNLNDRTAVVNQDLVTCSNCGRGFMKERIAKHEKACKKASARIKKPFDAKRKRAEGTDMEKYLIMGKETSDDSQYKVSNPWIWRG